MQPRSETCRGCGASDPEHFQANVSAGDDLVCTRCGLVVRPGSMVYAPGSTSVRENRAVCSGYRRSTHFRERLRSWTANDPRIPAAWLQRLGEAYDRLRLEPPHPGFARRENRSSGPLLRPAEVRLIIHAANLSQKQLSERFVSIRSHLQGRMCLPQPTAEQYRQIEHAYERFVVTWEQNAHLRGGRRNIVNLNMIIMQLILRYCGQAAYDAHLPDFLQTSRKKWISLFSMYCRVLRRMKWVVHCPVKRVVLYSCRLRFDAWW